MEKIAVLGAGTMGSGIAQVVARAGFEVYLRDIKQKYVEQGLEKIKNSLDYLVAKDKIEQEESQRIISRINPVVDIEALADADLVIEAAVEKMEIKEEIFTKLDQSCKEEAILVSNTSALSITEIAAATTRPEQVMGMHFFNPAPVMDLVELIKGVATCEQTFNKVEEFTQKIDKEPIEVEETPGFIVNRILIPMINEAVFLLNQGAASAEDIDTAMELGANHSLGPLALADLIGLDICLEIMDTLYNELKDSKYRACPLLRKKVRAKELGRKTGQGFFSYN